MSSINEYLEMKNLERELKHAEERLLKIKKIISKTRRKTRTRTRTRTIQKKDECCICFEQLKENGSATLDCGHKFHLCCIIKLQLSTTQCNKCPLCRGEFECPTEKLKQINFLSTAMNSMFENNRKLTINSINESIIANIFYYTDEQREQFIKWIHERDTELKKSFHEEDSDISDEEDSDISSEENSDISGEELNGDFTLQLEESNGDFSYILSDEESNDGYILSDDE